MSTNPSLYQLMADEADLSEAMADADEDSAQRILDRLDQLHAKMDDKLDAYASRRQLWLAMADLCDAEAKRMRERAARFRKRVDALLDRVAQLMQANGEQRRETAIATWWLQAKPPSVEIGSPDDVPRELCRHKAESWAPDKRAILAKIRAGEAVPGCRIADAEYSVRVSS